MTIFSKLSTQETELLYRAPALVTILIGAADGKLDGEERSWSERLLRTRTYAGQADLQEYYMAVSESFWVTLQHELQALPKEADARNTAISSQLEGLNPVFEKLDHSVAYGLYKGLKGLAEETAKASGGFLRIGAISADEYQWVELPMLTPIAPHEEDSAAGEHSDM